jgi:4-hydroxy-tetrahydrodipicolinate synthase
MTVNIQKLYEVFAMITLRGAFTAMITPMKKDGSVDYDGFRKLLKFQLEEGINGIVPLGTSGETPTLDEDEEQKLIDIIMPEVRSFEKAHNVKIPVVLGAGSNNTRDAVRYTERAKKAGADAALVVTPYYNKPSAEGIYRHFEAVSKVGIPVLVYNIQGRTGKNIDTETLMRIADLPNIAGVKEASGNISQMMDVIAKIKPKHPGFAVLSGDDGLTLPLIAAGGDGVVSVVSNLNPKIVTEMVQAALKGDFEKARAIHYRLLPFFKAAFVDGNPTSIKYAMNVKGLPAGSVRLPLVEVTDDAKKTIEAALRACSL